MESKAGEALFRNSPTKKAVKEIAGKEKVVMSLEEHKAFWGALTDYYKWRVSLVVIVLGFSVTFTSKIPEMGFTWILGLGWLALTICLLACGRIIKSFLIFFISDYDETSDNDPKKLELWFSVEEVSFILGVILVVAFLVANLKLDIFPVLPR